MKQRPYIEGEVSEAQFKEIKRAGSATVIATLGNGDEFKLVNARCRKVEKLRDGRVRVRFDGELS